MKLLFQNYFKLQKAKGGKFLEGNTKLFTQSLHGFGWIVFQITNYINVNTLEFELSGDLKIKNCLSTYNEIRTWELWHLKVNVFVSLIMLCTFFPYTYFHSLFTLTIRQGRVLLQTLHQYAKNRSPFWWLLHIIGEFSSDVGFWFKARPPLCHTLAISVEENKRNTDKLPYALCVPFVVLFNTLINILQIFTTRTWPIVIETLSCVRKWAGNVKFVYFRR